MVASYGLRSGLHVRRIDPAAESEREPVPAIDDVDDQRERETLLLRELELQRLVGGLVCRSFGQPRQGFGPAECGAFPVGIAGRIAPGRQQIDALLGFAVLAANTACMLVQTAQPLIWEARIFTSSPICGSKLAEIAKDMLRQSCIRAGAAVTGLSLAVMIGGLVLVPPS